MRELPGPVEAVLGEALHLDGADTSELVEQDATQLGAPGRVDLSEQVRAVPGLLVSGDLDQVAVVDLEQPGLLEVGHGDAPAPLQVHVQLVLHDRAQGALGVGLGLELRVRGQGEVPRLQVEGRDDGRGHRLVP